MNGQERGLLVAVDDIESENQSELSQLAAVVQHFIREELPIGLVMAGPTAAFSSVLDEGAATFLRRAKRYDLHNVDVAQVRQAFDTTFRGSGIAIEASQMVRMAEATGGDPRLVQLVGYHVWQLAVRDGNKVTERALQIGYERARRKHSPSR